MLLWRASGAHSSRSWSTTVITEAGRKQLERSRNISRSSIIASAARPGWDSCHPRSTASTKLYRRRISRRRQPPKQHQQDDALLHHLTGRDPICPLPLPNRTYLHLPGVRPGGIAPSRRHIRGRGQPVWASPPGDPGHAGPGGERRPHPNYIHTRDRGVHLRWIAIEVEDGEVRPRERASYAGMLY